MSNLMDELNISKKILNNILDLFSSSKGNNTKSESYNLLNKLDKNNKIIVMLLNKIQKKLDNKIDNYYKSSDENVNIEYLEKIKDTIEIILIILKSPKLIYKLEKTHRNIKEIIKYL
jgi:hypothetical protein